MCSSDLVLFGANIGVFQTPVFSWFDFVTDYLLIPTVVVLYLGHKLLNKTRLVPLKEANFELGSTETEQDSRH